MNTVNYELRQDVDEQDWIRANPVYCPVPWCSAHVLRTARCGDMDGPYLGIHAARLDAVDAASRRTRADLHVLRQLGVQDAETSLALARWVQDSVDHGLLPGRKGRRRLFR